MRVRKTLRKAREFAEEYLPVVEVQMFVDELPVFSVRRFAAGHV